MNKQELIGKLNSVGQRVFEYYFSTYFRNSDQDNGINKMKNQPEILLLLIIAGALFLFDFWGYL